MRVHEEYFLPGEVIMEQGSAVDQIYIVAHGSLVGNYLTKNGFEYVYDHASRIVGVHCTSVRLLWMHTCMLCICLHICILHNDLISSQWEKKKALDDLMSWTVLLPSV